jgi:hypothetical protein
VVAQPSTTAAGILATGYQEKTNTQDAQEDTDVSGYHHRSLMWDVQDTAVRYDHTPKINTIIKIYYLKKINARDICKGSLAW